MRQLNEIPTWIIVLVAISIIIGIFWLLKSHAPSICVLFDQISYSIPYTDIDIRPLSGICRMIAGRF